MTGLIHLLCMDKNHWLSAAEQLRYCRKFLSVVKHSYRVYLDHHTWAKFPWWWRPQGQECWRSLQPGDLLMVPSARILTTRPDLLSDVLGKTLETGVHVYCLMQNELWAPDDAFWLRRPSSKKNNTLSVEVSEAVTLEGRTLNRANFERVAGWSKCSDFRIPYAHFHGKTDRLRQYWVTTEQCGYPVRDLEGRPRLWDDGIAVNRRFGHFRRKTFVDQRLLKLSIFQKTIQRKHKSRFSNTRYQTYRVWDWDRCEIGEFIWKHHNAGASFKEIADIIEEAEIARTGRVRIPREGIPAKEWYRMQAGVSAMSRAMRKANQLKQVDLIDGVVYRYWSDDRVEQAFMAWPEMERLINLMSESDQTGSDNVHALLQKAIEQPFIMPENLDAESPAK